MKQLYLYMLDVITPFYISLPSWPNFNTHVLWWIEKRFLSLQLITEFKSMATYALQRPLLMLTSTKSLFLLTIIIQLHYSCEQIG
jgi:hypothetical protein